MEQGFTNLRNLVVGKTILVTCKKCLPYPLFSVIDLKKSTNVAYEIIKKKMKRIVYNF